MTMDEARVFLARGTVIDRELRMKRVLIQQLKDRASQLRGMRLTGMPRSGQRADMTRVVDDIIDAENELVAQCQQLMGVLGEVKQAVDAVENPLWRQLLTYRYVACLSWEEVAEHMGYDTRYIYKLHNNALKAFAKGREDLVGENH